MRAWLVPPLWLGLSLLTAACAVERTEAQRLLADFARIERDVLAPEGSGYRRLPVRWLAERREMSGDLYVPSQPAGAALVLVPGLSERGKEDPRLANAAVALARAGFAVLVPEIAGLRRLRIGPSDTEDVAWAALFLADADRPEVPPGPVGVAAISYSAGPAVLAALDPEAGEVIDFVFTIGGYYDMAAVITYMTTGWFRDGPDGLWQQGSPDPRIKWGFLRANADRFVSAPEAETLIAIADRRIAGRDAADLVAQLGPEGRAVYALIVNTDPNAVPGLIAAAPQGLRDMIRAVSPAAHDLGALRARLLLVHGGRDPTVPISESRRLLAAAPSGRAQLFEIGSLSHVALERPSAYDWQALLQAVDTLIAMRDQLARPPSPSAGLGAP